MAVSDIEAVLDFLRKNGFTEAESAFREDIVERGDFGSFDLEKFEFPMSPRPPPVRIFLAHGRSEVSSRVDGSVSSSDSSEDFLSVCSSTTNGSPSGFTNPYGLMSAARVKSDASSDILSEFGTARNYHDSDILNDMYWCDEKDGGGYVKYPGFGGTDFFNCPSEDKFVTTSEAKWLYEKPFGLNVESEGFHSVTSINFLEKPYIFHNAAIDSDHLKTLKEPNLGETQLVHVGEIFSDYDSTLENKRSVSSIQGIERGSANNFNGEEFQKESDLHLQDTEKSFQSDGNDGFDIEDGGETVGEPHEPGNEEECGIEDELPMYDNHEDEYEVFNLRIIHRKNRTGFEENKDLPIVLNSIIAGRYYVTEYLGSAAFSKVIQAHDLQTGIDVCLKIIKNDKDFFDQSLDEIKLLKMVNKHDPGDKHHILRLYDYFYHQEHLFIVCELLRANLYEFQKFNQESGGEVYFTSRRLQLITRQCLEALDYLHNLGIIHCDLKPENILIKSYSRCEIKIIDLGSSCFQMDNLCLYVQSRSYRAPEVILGLPYDQKIDIWSLGCILAELCSGDVLFPNDGLVMLLARMIGMLGPIDMEMLVRGQETYKYFTKEYDLYHLNEETNQLEYIIPEQSSLEYRLQVSDIGFVGFVKDLLETNPNRRPTAAEALRHPWLSYPYE